MHFLRHYPHLFHVLLPLSDPIQANLTTTNSLTQVKLLHKLKLSPSQPCCEISTTNKAGQDMSEKSASLREFTAHSTSPGPVPVPANANPPWRGFPGAPVSPLGRLRTALMVLLPKPRSECGHLKQQEPRLPAQGRAAHFSACPSVLKTLRCWWFSLPFAGFFFLLHFVHYFFNSWKDWTKSVQKYITLALNTGQPLALIRQNWYSWIWVSEGIWNLNVWKIVVMHALFLLVCKKKSRNFIKHDKHFHCWQPSSNINYCNFPHIYIILAD